ncbi:MAG: thioredoxin domain-containing protein [Parvibaculales bacterium]
MTQNLLAAQASPYLQQHKDNPVHWMPWGEQALALARQNNKPILLSIGYAACHWCHVMAHESFEDPETAKVVNELFVNIKVDREERPEIDDIYMGALHMMGVQGGWPLTMFLTPQGEPFWGGTYFPKIARAGMPAFTDVCREISRLYHEESDKVRANAEQLTQAAKRRSLMVAKADAVPDFCHQAAKGLFDHMDQEHGGMQGSPKFPQPFVFSYIWESGYFANREDMRLGVHHTAAKVGSGGIYDHLGGGFARYSVDARWCVPHFEKMLYDNALMVDLLTTLYKEDPKALYRNRVEDTVAWLTREMLLPGGAFAASLDADTEGEEGKFYVWTQEEISEVLDDKAQAFMAYYDVTPQGNFEGTTVLNTLDTQDNVQDAHFNRAREMLLARRETRPKPDCDDKVLADWNGLVIAALSRAASVFDRPDWLDMACDAYGFIRGKMSRQKDGYVRLVHVWCGGVLGDSDTVEDYANMMDAALSLYEATGRETFLVDAISWVATLDAFFACRDAGGYFMTASDAEAIPVRPRHARDNALPNANGTLIWVLSRLAALTGEANYARSAELLADSFWLHTEKEFPQMTTTLSSLLKHHHIVSCVVAGDENDKSTQTLLAAAHRHQRPGLVIQPVFTVGDISPAHPAFEALTGKRSPVAQAYLCLQDKCLAPVETAEDLTEKLNNL